MNAITAYFVLPIMTIAAQMYVLKSLAQTLNQPIYPAVPTVEQTLDVQRISWRPRQADQTLPDKDLLEMPLESLKAEIQWLSAPHEWSTTWFSLLLPQVVKLNCGVDLADLPLERQVEAANFLSLALESSLSSEARAALGREDQMQEMHRRLATQMQGASAELRADLTDKAAKRLAAIMPNAQALELEQHDSFAITMLHFAILYDVWQQTAPSEQTTAAVMQSSCTIPADDLKPQTPVRLALK